MMNNQNRTGKENEYEEGDREEYQETKIWKERRKWNAETMPDLEGRDRSRKYSKGGSRPLRSVWKGVHVWSAQCNTLVHI